MKTAIKDYYGDDKVNPNGLNLINKR